MIIFEREFDFTFYNGWKITIDDGWMVQFRLFTLEVGDTYFGMWILNFGWSVNWYF